MTWRSKLGAVALGILGMLVGLGLVHLYADHNYLHALVALEQQRQTAKP